MGRMVTTGAKWFFGLTALAMVAAAIYGWGSRGGLSGPVTGGLVRAVGEQAGYMVLASLAVASLFLGGVVTAVRDADADAVAAVAGTDGLPAASPPAGNSHWPAIAAFGVGVAIVGLAVGALLFVIGLFVVGIALVEWTVRAWADRATGDPVANRQIRDRFMHPIEFPIAGALAIGVVVLCVSRVLLALPETAADATAIGLAIVVLTTAGLIAWRPRIARSVLTAVVVLFAMVVIAGGIIAAAHGSRTYEKEGGTEEPAP